MTFASARAILLAGLAARGWQVSSGLKIDHARSPEGNVALFFKSQAIYAAPLSGTQSASSALKSAHSLFLDSKILANAGDKGVEDLVRVARRFVAA